ncbi:hypothetical protein EDD18DRAFT_1101819 [Armillaria luteobubalina]|uniref:Uncharacterized protein n=1 Tax=Armillaria luteobubalina TaxID=153913 RepID=A0AA39QEI2_9AGAR|nr:hypothetical protein EDD18DRAFT_1101819 [Armillaria luteobubalina]
MAYYYHNRHEILPKMRKRYAKRVGKDSTAPDRHKKAKESTPEPVPPLNPEITSLAHQIRLLDGQLFALTDNSIHARTARVCKVTMKPRVAGDMVEKMLECLQGLESDVDEHHNVIYSAGGLCKEWQDTQATLLWIQIVSEWTAKSNSKKCKMAETIWPLLSDLPTLPLPNLIKGWAKGKRLIYLELSVATYNEKRVIGSKKTNEYAMTTIVNEYFKQFFWALPLNQDPESDDPAFMDDAELSEEQLTVKVAVIKQMSTAIPKWLEYCAGKTFTPHALSMKQLMHDLIASFLSRLSGIDGPCLHLPTAKQLFGKDNNEINRRFEALWSTRGGQIKDRAAARASFVVEEFKKLSEETKKTWALRAVEAVEATKKSRGSVYAQPMLLPPEEAQKYALESTLNSHSEPNAFRRVIDSLAAYFGPLLEGVSKMIGCNILMVFVGPELWRGGQILIQSCRLHEGVDKLPVPVTFDEGGGEKYKFWLASLGEWGMSCFLPIIPAPEDQKARSLPGIGLPSGPPQFFIPDPPWRSVIPAGSAVLSEQVDQGIASGEDKSEVEFKTIKKKKSRTKGKKHTVDLSTIELEASKQKSKCSKGRDDQTEVCMLMAPQPQPSTRLEQEPQLSMTQNCLPALFQLSLEDTNHIDPALLTGGMTPSTYIPNCGPNDYPDPFQAGNMPPPPPMPSNTVPIRLEQSSRICLAYLDPENWPEWLGDKWDRVVDALSIVEGQRGFIKTGKPLQRTDRPPQSWWQWWPQMQPDSHGVGEGEGPVSVESRCNSGEWDKMDKPGQNGLYSVVASLAWWGESVSHNIGAWKEWCAAMDDVLWVLECLAAISSDA